MNQNNSMSNLKNERGDREREKERRKEEPPKICNYKQDKYDYPHYALGHCETVCSR